MKKSLHVEPKKVCAGALKTDPDEILVITESMSGNIDVFSSDGNAREMLNRARQHIDRLASQ